MKTLYYCYRLFIFSQIVTLCQLLFKKREIWTKESLRRRETFLYFLLKHFCYFFYFSINEHLYRNGERNVGNAGDYNFFKLQLQFLQLLTKHFNDSHRRKLALYWIQYKNSLKNKVRCFWRFSYVYTINKVILISLSYRSLKNLIHQIESKNECLLLSVTFTEN